MQLVDGTRKDRINRLEPMPTDLPIEPPGWLVDELALAEWERLAPDLIARGVLTAWDVQPFAEYCAAVARIAEAEAELANEGHMVKRDVFNRNGECTGQRVVRNEWAFILKDALEVSARRASRFGLTPSDRGGLTVGRPADTDERDPDRLLS